MYNYLIFSIFISCSTVFAQKTNGSCALGANKGVILKSRRQSPQSDKGHGPDDERHMSIGPDDSRVTKYTLPPTTTTVKIRRTTPFRLSFSEDCDYLAAYCLKAYDTGKICGRTIYYEYFTFRNYCMLDYVNCMERYEVWQIVHMGPCFQYKLLKDYIHYPYLDDYFLDQYYIIEDN